MTAPSPMFRSIESKWNFAKELLKDNNFDTIVVSTHYEYEDTLSGNLPSNILRRITLHILELIIGEGTRAYLRHTITISGKSGVRMI